VLLDLMADRGLRDVQLVCRPGEAQMARRSLEGTQRVERWQASRHPSFSQRNTNSNSKKSSLVADPWQPYIKARGGEVSKTARYSLQRVA
jgi:hypothetical protein